VEAGGFSAADDRFHPGETEDRSWTETCWFAAAVPEREMVIWTYPLFRPELGIMSCGIYVWGPGAEELWQLPYFRHWWHLPIPEGLDLADFTLPNGLHYEVLEPLTAYRVAYSDGEEIDLDFTFRALQPPHGVGVQGGRGHLDQLGHVTGEMTLAGERIEIDCVEMRDRTWGPRRESRKRTYLTYSYGADRDADGFHFSAIFDEKLGHSRILTGYRLRGGEAAPFEAGSTEVERDAAGRPERVRVTARGEDGEEFEATGTILSRLSQPSTPWYVWVGLVRWTLPDGTEVYGEHQDTWSPAALRKFLRAR
jgi:hypothetical protein